MCNLLLIVLLVGCLSTFIARNLLLIINTTTLMSDFHSSAFHMSDFHFYHSTILALHLHFFTTLLKCNECPESPV